MARGFDDMPMYDPVVKEESLKLSDIWSGYFSSFIETLISYLSENGIFVPKLTTAERNLIQTPEEGQMIFNTTTATGQIYQGGAWVNFS
jgi:hypothetical protein